MSATNSVYKQSGVDIDSGDRVVELIRPFVKSTHTLQVLSDTGLFGGTFSIDSPTVLVASTDSVGTKLRIAAILDRNGDIGVDIVNHCVNDILTCGARPLFFLDYFASGKLVPEAVAEIVEGIASACREAGCALLGGETAELPGVYSEGEYDLVGFIVGSVARDRMIDGSEISPGDVLVALPSSGLHTNGFSLVNHLLSEIGGGSITPDALNEHRPELGGSLAEALLVPHRSYLREVGPLLNSGQVKGIAHITGGGLPENLPRILPEGTSARIDTSSWQPQPIFTWLRMQGDVRMAEMYRVFNMGVGMVLAVAPEHADDTLSRISDAWTLGQVVEGGERVQLSGVAGA